MRKHRVLTTLTAGVAGLLCLLVQTSLAAPPVGNSSRPTGFATAAVRFDAATDQVTLTLPVQDRYGNYIPHAHPDNFVVYENGTPQKDITVQIKRSPLELGIVLEYGGRYPTLNEAISSAVSSAARNLLSDITEKDTVAVWTYGDRLVQISGFQKGPEGLQHALQSLITPPVSESNLYDAIAGALAHMRSRNDGRKALLVISSGVDTFSTTRYQDLLELAGTSGVPIYVIDVGAILKRDVSFSLVSQPYSRLDWKDADSRLAQIAQVSGGHVYLPDSSFDVPAAYDAMLYGLRARYVITYASPPGTPLGKPRTVRVELLEPQSGVPLRVADAHGAPRAIASIAGTYVRPSGAPPSAAAG